MKCNGIWSRAGCIIIISPGLRAADRYRGSAGLCVAEPDVPRIRIGLAGCLVHHEPDIGRILNIARRSLGLSEVVGAVAQ